MSDTPQPSASERPASSILDALAGEGEYVGDGGFTLDPERARAKLRAYALDDPAAYVLLLVEAAWLAGLAGLRSRVRFEHGSTTTVEFAGLPLDAAALANLLGAVFSRGEGFEAEAEAHHRARQKLGLAINAALALAPRRLEIEQRNPDGTSLRVAFAGPAGIGEVSRGTHDDRSGVAWTRLVFVGQPLDLRRAARERELLGVHASYAGFPVERDGKRISRGLEGALGPVRHGPSAPIAVEAQAPRRIIGAALRHPPSEADADADAGSLLIVTRGVLAETVSLQSFGPGFLAVVEADLRKDLSQRQIIRDDRFERVVAAAQRAADALPVIEAEPPGDASGQDGDEHDATWSLPKPVLWVLRALAVLAVLVMLYLTFIGVSAPVPLRSTWYGALECNGQDVTMFLRIDPVNERQGTLSIDGPAALEGSQKVRISGDLTDDDYVEIEFDGWLAQPSDPLGPLNASGWFDPEYGFVLSFEDDRCDMLILMPMPGSP